MTSEFIARRREQLEQELKRAARDLLTYAGAQGLGFTLDPPYSSILLILAPFEEIPRVVETLEDGSG